MYIHMYGGGGGYYSVFLLLLRMTEGCTFPVDCVNASEEIETILVLASRTSSIKKSDSDDYTM